MFRTRCCMLVLLGCAMPACRGRGGYLGGGQDGGSGPPGGGQDGGAGSRVASVSISTDAGPLQAGLVQVFEAVANDTSGAPLNDVAITWTSSDPTTAAIDALGVAVGVAPGTVSITASAGGATSAPAALAVVPPVAPGPTSEALIAAALNAGTIGAETALLYRVYAAFGDARLPAEYQGDDTWVFETNALDEAAAQFTHLSLATKAIIAPFYIPPYYSGSWLGLRDQAAGTGLRRADAQTPPGVDGGKWATVDSANGKVRIWYQLNTPDTGRDLVQAQTMTSLIDTVIWSKLTTMMGREPVSDASQSNNGGDGRLDISIVKLVQKEAKTNTTGITVRYPTFLSSFTCDGPVFIQLDRKADSGTLTHEIMHAIQRAFAVQANDCAYWWGEATATWAEDFVYPRQQTEQGQAKNFFAHPDLSLNTVGNLHEYGAYLLPFFTTCSSGGCDPSTRPSDAPMVRQSWINAEGASTLAAIDGALQSAGGFDAVWPEFVKDNWNRSWPPTQDYASWDKLDNVGRPSPSDATEIFLAGASDHYVQLSGISLPYLSAQYFWYRITDDSVHTIAFYNGVNFNLASKSVNNSPYTGQFDTYGLTPPASPQPGAKVQALMKYRGMDWQSDPVDLTTLPVVTLCRDVTAERLDEFVVIVSSSQYADPSATLQPPGEDPMIWFSNLPCWQLSGNATYTSTNDGVTETFTASNVVWQRLGAAQLSHPYQSFYVSSGTVRWSISGTDSAQCAYSGSATVSAAGYQNGLTIPAFATSGQLYRGVSQIVGIGPVQPFMETITCPNGGQSVARPAQWFVGSTVINFPHMVFDPTGASLANAETVGTAQYSWHFVSQPQP